jgi:hypothetical protein
MKTKTHFAFRVDIWDADANSIVEHVAGCGRFRGRGGDLPGSRGALASGTHHPAAGCAGCLRTRIISSQFVRLVSHLRLGHARAHYSQPAGHRAGSLGCPNS